MIKSESLGNNISELCKQQDIKQNELAEIVGVTEVSMSRYIRGERVPRLATLKKIAKALKTTPDYLLGCESEQMYRRARRIIICNSKNWTIKQKAELINTLLLDE